MKNSYYYIHTYTHALGNDYENGHTFCCFRLILEFANTLILNQASTINIKILSFVYIKCIRTNTTMTTIKLKV